MSAVLEARGLTAGHSGVAAVRDLELEMHAGEVIALLGANGSGKTTTLRTLAGSLPALTGQVFWNGSPTSAPMHRRARRGLQYIPESKLVVSALSVQDNLRLGRADISVAYKWFPELWRLRARRGGLLSGGEQQMLTMARAITQEPSVLLVDELSLGLAPMVADRLAGVLRQLADSGTAVLLVEQNLQRALAVSDRYYVLRHGQLATAGTSQAERGNEDRLHQYFLPLGSNTDTPDPFGSNAEGSTPLVSHESGRL